MNADEALRFIEDLILENEKRINDLQRVVFREAWQGKSYKEIHQAHPVCSLEHLMRNVGPKLWKLIAEVIHEPVSKANLQGPIERAWVERSTPLISQPSASVSPTSASTLNTNNPPLSIADWQQQPEPTSAVSNADNNTFDEVIFGGNVRDVEEVGEAKSSSEIGYVANQYPPDWGNAIDVSLFYGRTRELTQLEQWSIIDGCRVILLFGMGGMGKTALSVKLAQRVRYQFEFLIWRSLKNWQLSDRPPSFPTLLNDLIRYFSQQQESSSMVDCADLLNYLVNHRCLLVLDSWETVLAEGVHDGSYAEGYQVYSDFLRQVGAIDHQSCVILTSREKPKEIAVMEGENHPVRSWELTGLGAWEGQEIFLARNAATELELDWNAIVQRYSGNPFALEIAATIIRNLFSGNISYLSEQLHQEATLFNDICQLLEQHLKRLSDVEKQVVNYLTASHEPVTITHIIQAVDPEVTWTEMQEVLQSLKRRSLIKIDTMYCSLQPLLMEYLSTQVEENPDLSTN